MSKIQKSGVPCLVVNSVSNLTQYLKKIFQSSDSAVLALVLLFASFLQSALKHCKQRKNLPRSIKKNYKKPKRNTSEVFCCLRSLETPLDVWLPSYVSFKGLKISCQRS